MPIALILRAMRYIGVGGADGGHVVGLDVTDDLAQGVEAFLDGEVQSVVHCADGIGHPWAAARSGVILPVRWRNCGRGATGPQIALVVDPGACVLHRHGGDDGAVESSADEQSRGRSPQVAVLARVNSDLSCSGRKVPVGEVRRASNPAGEEWGWGRCRLASTCPGGKIWTSSHNGASAFISEATHSHTMLAAAVVKPRMMPMGSRPISHSPVFGSNRTNAPHPRQVLPDWRHGRGRGRGSLHNRCPDCQG